jgi:hypothetical protein
VSERQGSFGINYPNFQAGGALHHLGQKSSSTTAIRRADGRPGNFSKTWTSFFRVAGPLLMGRPPAIAVGPHGEMSASLRRIVTALTVWMDGDGNIQKTDATLPKGDRVVTTYKNVRPAKTSDAKFEFTPPREWK